MDVVAVTYEHTGALDETLARNGSLDALKHTISLLFPVAEMAIMHDTSSMTETLEVFRFSSVEELSVLRLE